MTTASRVVRRPDTTLVIFGESRQHTYKLSQRSVLALEQHIGRAVEFVAEDELRAALTTLGLASLALDAADGALLPPEAGRQAGPQAGPVPKGTAGPDATVVLPPGALPPGAVAPRPDATRQSPPLASAYPYTVQSAPTRQSASTTPPAVPPGGRPGGAPAASGGPGRGAGLVVGLLAAAFVLLLILLISRFVLRSAAPSTPTPVLLPTATLALPTAVPGAPMVTAQIDTPVLAGPGSQYPTVGSLLAGQSSQAVGASADGLWWVIRFPAAPGQQGWVPSNTVQAQNTSGLPVVPPPPVPTATPSPSPTPTATVVQPPVAVITGPSQGEVGKQLIFSASKSTAGAGATLARYEWDFGDNTQANGVDIAKIYQNPGIYNVTLTVVDSNNLASKVVQPVSIMPPVVTATPAPPRAVISAPPQAQVDQPVTFDGSASTASEPLTAYNWTFGDGGTATGVRVEHTYRNPGIYNVTLTVRVRSGVENTAVAQITIVPAPVTPTPPPPATPTPTSTPATPPIVGTSWSLLAYDTGQSDLTPVLAGAQITAQFGQDGRLTGSGGCNTYNAAYDAGAELLKIGPAATSGQTCSEPAGVTEQETAYLALLTQVTGYRMGGGRLELFDGLGKVLLRYGQ